MTGTPVPAAPYLAPDVGFDALKAACALIKCTASGDTEGIGAVLDGTERPLELAGMLAAIAAAVCVRVGLTPETTERLLADISGSLSNWMLDQEQPTGEVTSHG